MCTTQVCALPFLPRINSATLWAGLVCSDWGFPLVWAMFEEFWVLEDKGKWDPRVVVGARRRTKEHSAVSK